MAAAASREDSLKLPNGYVGSLYVPSEYKYARKLYYFDNNGFYLEVLRLARNGDPQAAAMLGMLHYNGSFFPYDSCVEVTDWADISAKMQNPYGLFVKAMVEIDDRRFSTAARLLKDSAEIGFGPASWALGALCEIGVGVPRSLREALRHYRDASRRGYVLARPSIVELYRTGEFGLPKQVAGFLLDLTTFVVLGLKQVFARKITEKYLIADKFIAGIGNGWKPTQAQ